MRQHIIGYIIDIIKGSCCVGATFADRLVKMLIDSCLRELQHTCWPTLYYNSLVRCTCIRVSALKNGPTLCPLPSHKTAVRVTSRNKGLSRNDVL